MMLLSIITVNLNNANGLRKTLDSVASQIYTDFEIIIVDGASTDGSIEVINQFTKTTTHHFSIISESDSGVYQAMNKGIRKAKGEYLLFLNSGDFLVKDQVLHEVFIKKHTADFLLARCNITENNKVVYTTQPSSSISFGFLYYVGLAHQSSFIKRELFEIYGNYREDFKYNSDIEFWYRTIILAYCTTESLDTIVSDYNLDGMSSKDSNKDVYLKEMNEIYEHPLFKKFTPDYEYWLQEEKSLESLIWLKKKKSLFVIVECIYKFSNWMVEKIK